MRVGGIVLGVLGVVVVVLAAVIGWVVVPNVIENAVEKETRLLRGSDTWNKWSDIENPVFMNFYIFNVTNPDEVEFGLAPPKLQQLGPYVYRQRRQKLDPHTKDCKDTVTYEQKITYFFDQERSGGLKESDVVNTPNVPIISVLKVMYDMFMAMYPYPELVPGYVGQIADILRTDGRNETLIRRNVAVGEVTFAGYDVRDYEIIGSVFPLPEEFDGYRFGIYKGRNGTTDGVYEVYTGATDSALFGKVKTWRGSASLPFWNSTECNQILGTDGSIFPPFREKDSHIDIFQTDLCRPLRLDYTGEVTVQDVTTFRFSPHPRVLAGIEINPDNECYCLRQNRSECVSGVIDISVCRNGAPIILSTPHFFGGHFENEGKAMGLSANEHLHQTTIDIEPRTGLLFEAHKRIQVNVEVRPKELEGHVFQYRNLTDMMLLPVLWIDEEAGMCKFDVDDFKSRVEAPIKAVNIGRWVAIGVGIALVILAAGLEVWSWRKERNKGSTA